MIATVIALIGHSGAGKSSCLAHLRIGQEADMDVALGTTASPQMIKAMEWITSNDRPSVVVVSNHEEMLKAMHRAKLNHEHSYLFDAVHFVYLRKPKVRLARHLLLPTSGGNTRPQDGQKYTLAHYDRFDQMFKDLSDQIIDCTTSSIDNVSNEVRILGDCAFENRVNV